jgi:hypothetical protein
MCVDALPKQLDFASFARGIDEFGHTALSTVGESAHSFVCFAGSELKTKAFQLMSTAAYIVKDAYRCDLALASVADFIKMIDLHAKADSIGRPMLAAIVVTRDFMDAVKILKSIDYMANKARGDFDKFVRGDVCPFISEVALAIGRSLSTLHWLAAQRLIDLEHFAALAASIGGEAAFHAAKAVTSTTLMNSAFIVALIGLASQCVYNIEHGRDPVPNALDCVSLAAYTATTALAVLGMANPAVSITFGFVAASTGLAAELVKPRP